MDELRHPQQAMANEPNRTRWSESWSANRKEQSGKPQYSSNGNISILERGWEKGICCHETEEGVFSYLDEPFPWAS